MSAKKTHLLFINQYYWPDFVATAIALTELAEYLVNNGYEVTIVTGRHFYKSDTQKLPKTEVHNGVRIIRIDSTNLGRASIKHRLIDYFTFYVQAFKASISLKIDVVVTLTTPPLLGSIGFFLKLFKNISFIYWSMDLHPEAEEAVGLLKKDSMLGSILFTIHEWILHAATKIVHLNHNMLKRLMKYRLEESKTRHISIWSDEEKVKPIAKLKSSFKTSSGSEKFVVHYSGNLGLAHDDDILFDVIESFIDDDDISFIFTGGGPKYNQLKSRVNQAKFNNVSFNPYVELDKLSSSLAQSDLLWFTLLPSFEGIAYPSKLISYLAAGRPILFVGDEFSDSATIIEEAQAGTAFKLNQIDEICNWIRTLKDDKQMQVSMGSKARVYFEENLTKEKLCGDWKSLLDELISIPS